MESAQHVTPQQRSPQGSCSRNFCPNSLTSAAKVPARVSKVPKHLPRMTLWQLSRQPHQTVGLVIKGSLQHRQVALALFQDMSSMPCPLLLGTGPDIRKELGGVTSHAGLH